jgi:2-polyprenyl-3-methyl-5-hydroxy-6-metoxy-1,4-benzoquinol methylase
MKQNADNQVDMALAVGAKKLHEGRQFMYEQIQQYHRQFIDPTTGYCKAEYLEERNCPVCDSSSYRQLFVKGGGRHVACQQCGMVYLNPVFTDKALADYYAANHAAQAEVTSKESDFYRRIYSKGLSIIGKYIPAGKILDIGCSSGFFLDIAKLNGWRTMGIELNTAEAALAQAKHEVYTVPIDSLGADKKCDAITMWDVFEHIKDGNKILRTIASQHLCPGGLIFLQVPNAKALAARVMQEKCNMFDGIEHVNLYDPQTIRLLADKNGMDVLHLETVISEIPIVANYLEYQDPYFGEAPHNGKVFGLIDETAVHANLLGYKMQVALRPREFTV